MKKIGIIGGGISGLTAAFLLKQKGFEVSLFEKSDRTGGNIQTVEIDGFRVEYAPNSFLKSPRVVDLIRELDLEAEVLAANEANKKRYVLRDGKLKSLPMSVWKIAAGDYFSVRAKVRILKEPLVKSKSSAEESVAEFFERRLGREVLTRAADPFIAGIYAGDAARLSVKAAFPRLYELESKYGSLLKGALFSKTEKADKNFPRTFSFRNGAQTLTDRLAENLGATVKTSAQVISIERLADGKFAVSWERRHPACTKRESANTPDARQSSSAFSDDAGRMPALPEVFDVLIISTPATAAANLLGNLDADLPEKIKSIYYPSVAMVFFGVKKESVGVDLDGFGFLIPSSEKRKILGTVFNSAVLENRAPEGFHLLTTFVGGARNAEIYEQSDAELYETVFAELERILDLREPPVFRHLKRWRRAIPQYNIGYDKIETAIENFENRNKGIFFCSNFYKGISVGDCVKNAYALAEKISHEQTRKGTKDFLENFLKPQMFTDEHG